MALLLQDAEAGAMNVCPQNVYKLGTGGITFTLPFPISVNGMFAGKARRYKSQRYCDWLLEAGHALNRLKPPQIKGQYHILYTFQEPGTGGLNNQERDAFNYEKGITDLLVKHGVVQGDSHKYLREGSVKWDKSVVGVRVTITPLSVVSESVEASHGATGQDEKEIVV